MNNQLLLPLENGKTKNRYKKAEQGKHTVLYCDTTKQCKFYINDDLCCIAELPTFKKVKQALDYWHDMDIDTAINTALIPLSINTIKNLLQNTDYYDLSNEFLNNPKKINDYCNDLQDDIDLLVNDLQDDELIKEYKQVIAELSDYLENIN